jgi:hypothetical protein
MLPDAAGAAAAELAGAALEAAAGAELAAAGAELEEDDERQAD